MRIYLNPVPLFLARVTIFLIFSYFTVQHLRQMRIVQPTSQDFEANRAVQFSQEDVPARSSPLRDNYMSSNPSRFVNEQNPGIQLQYPSGRLY